NQQANVFLWKGKLDRDQRILPAYWDGSRWRWTTFSRLHAPSVETLIHRPQAEKNVHVLLYQQPGAGGRDRIHTQRVFFAALPPLEKIVEEGLKKADTVLHDPNLRWPPPKTEWQDCLKGDLTRSEWKAVAARSQGSRGLVFLRGQGAKSKVLFWFDTVQGAFHGPEGELRLQADERRADRRPGSALRWELARAAAVKEHGDRPGCLLRV